MPAALRERLVDVRDALCELANVADNMNALPNAKVAFLMDCIDTVFIDFERLASAADRVVNDAGGPGAQGYRVGRESMDALRGLLRDLDADEQKAALVAVEER